MQSFRSETWSGVFRNPSILAMIGSVGVHSVFVLFSALKPAESLSNKPLSIVSINAGSSTPNLNQLLAANGLPVPSGLPPINLGDVPELSALPDLSRLGRSSQSMFLGSDPSSINLGKLSIANPPQKSVPGSQTPVYGINLPKTPSQGGTGFLQTPYPDYSVNPYQSPPTVNPGSITIGRGTVPPSPLLPSPSTSGTPDPGDAGTNAAEARERYARYLESKKQAYGTGLSTQAGPRLTASYPPSACQSKAQGSALLAALFDPDGAIKSDSIQILQSAETLALNRAAIAAVESYRPAPSGVIQSLTFTVDIPYSEAVCSAGSSPKAPDPSQSSPTPTSSPISSPIPSPTPSQTSSPSSTPSPSPESRSSKPVPKASPGSAADLSDVTPASVKSTTETSQVPSLKERNLSNLSTPSLEPIPAPSITVPEGSPPLP